MKKILLAILLASQCSVGQILADQAENGNPTDNSLEKTVIKPILMEKKVLAKNNAQINVSTSKKADKRVTDDKKIVSSKKTIETPKTVIHIVEAKQTLFFLLKKYNTKETDFLKANPGFDKTMPLKLGQKLTFKPSLNIENNISASKPKAAEKTSREIIIKQEAGIKSNAIVNANGKTKQTPLPAEAYHIVQPQETIFSLAKKYGLDITEFVEANNLTDNVIKPGQKLIISKVEIIKQKAIFEKAKEPVYVQKQIGKKVVEEGIAQVVKTKSRTNKFLALHRTAKSGSIIKVTNEANGTAIFAKIVGNMNAVGPDQHIMLKLSPLAYYQLKPKDSKMRAKIEYFTPM